MVAEEDSRRADAVLLGDLVDVLVFEERRACAAERAVRGDVDALLLAVIYDFLLGKKRVVLNLVGGGDNGGLRKKLLEVLDRVVCDTNGLDLVGVGLDQLLETLPGVDVGD